jgi:hypothetical protein
LAEEVTGKNQFFVRLYFPLSEIQSPAAQRLAEFANVFSEYPAAPRCFYHPSAVFIRPGVGGAALQSFCFRIK